MGNEVTAGGTHGAAGKKVIILATGGTIAGSGQKGRETGYVSGTLSVDDILHDIPSVSDKADIETIQICNVNSDDITSDIWISLSCTINELASDESVAGFVVTHGTDTLEETAYFLDMTVKTEKCVVLTGSMRPATALSADGPLNLYQAICVAASEKSTGKGVLVLFSNSIFSARSVKKINTYNVMAVSAGESGSIGVVRNDEVEFYDTPVKRHTVNTEFHVDRGSGLPRVMIVYFNVDADPGLLKYAADNSEGIIIAGAGAGEFSRGYMDIINKVSVPVVISSRINDGIITQDSVLCGGTIAANDLSPQKAAVLLRLALYNKTASQQELIRIFGLY